MAKTPATNVNLSVRLGLHGLGDVLKAIYDHNLQEKFIKEVGENDLVVSLGVETAKKLKNFALNHLPDDHPLRERLNRDNCDPATDPWCINI